MNFLRNGLVTGLIQKSLSIFSCSSSITTTGFNHALSLPVTNKINLNYFSPLISQNRAASLFQLHRRGPYKRKKKLHKVMDCRPFMKGVVLKTLVRKPRKPNSANRKCVLVKLSNGKEVIAFVPGEGHNLQEHQFVLICGKGVKDTPGIKVRCVRGKYDLPLVTK